MSQVIDDLDAAFLSFEFKGERHAVYIDGTALPLPLSASEVRALEGNASDFSAPLMEIEYSCNNEAEWPLPPITLHVARALINLVEQS